MNIHLYLDNEDETLITSFYDLVSNPFKIGDDININIEEFYPIELSNLSEEVKNNRVKENEEIKKTLNRKKVRIIREGKYLRFKFLGEPKLTIEYHCVCLNEN